MVHAARKHLGDKVSFQVPNAGMFVWMDLKIPDTKKLGEKMTEAGVAVVPGGMFQPVLEASQSRYVRVSYCQATDEDLEKGMIKIARLMQ